MEIIDDVSSEFVQHSNVGGKITYIHTHICMYKNMLILQKKTLSQDNSKKTTRFTEIYHELAVFFFTEFSRKFVINANYFHKINIWRPGWQFFRKISRFCIIVYIYPLRRRGGKEILYLRPWGRGIFFALHTGFCFLISSHLV